jgi:3'-5' exoribonuclease
MKSPFVSELETSKVFTATFLVHSKEIRQKKSGEPYLSLQLGDRTGDVEAKMWDNVAEVMHTFERDDFVRVKGLLQIYNNRPQVTIHKMQRVDEREVDLCDYFPASGRDPEEMMAELRGMVGAMSNPHLRALVESFLDDPEIGVRYRRAPAAKAIHHAYLGGLLEHVLSLCNACALMVRHYKTLDLDLLLAGAILHDIGKIYELSYDRGFGYSTEGQLLGHIAIAVRLLERKIAALCGFPEHLRLLVEHMILSHHGQLEFGSPKVPLFPEALVLHYLDDLDAKMECMRSLVEQDRQVDGHWTGYSAPLDRVVLKKLKYLTDHEREDAGATPPVASAVEDPAPCTGDVPVSVSAPAALEAAAAPEHAGPAPVESASARPAPPVALRRPEPPRREPRTPTLFGEKLGQALQGLREDK